jgi:Ran GTPase-activating protein (RanGAP) involved in mRNA processing and transport
MDYFFLPDDIIRYLCKFLTNKDILILGAVSKKFNNSRKYITKIIFHFNAPKITDNIFIPNNLTDNQIKDFKIVFNNFCKSLHKFTSLKILDISHNYIDTDQCNLLAHQLKYTKHLTELIIINNLIKSYGASTIANSLHKHKYLKNLDMWNNEIGNYGMNSVMILAKCNSSLQTVNMGFNRITNDSAKYICNSVNSLKKLDIAYNTLNSNYIYNGMTVKSRIKKLTKKNGICVNFF